MSVGTQFKLEHYILLDLDMAFCYELAVVRRKYLNCMEVYF
jgi:hypothetical protein